MVGFFRKKNKAIENLAKEVHALGGMVDLLSNRVESLENSSSKKKEDEAPSFAEIRGDWLKGAEEE